MDRFRRIMHASDFSPASRAAFARALDLAKLNRAELTVVHVLTPVMPVAGGEPTSPRTWEELEAATRAGGQKGLKTLLARARKAGVRVRGVLLEGIPHEQIVRAAKRRRTDVLVMGTHGRTGLAKFFLGSVTARVVATASCPVLTVRGR
jgi:nucleotide-binding universal stress UspA family protein